MYKRKTWVTREVVTKDALNNMEVGIEEAHADIIVLKKDQGDTTEELLNLNNELDTTNKTLEETINTQANIRSEVVDLNNRLTATQDDLLVARENIVEIKEVYYEFKTNTDKSINDINNMLEDHSDNLEILNEEIKNAKSDSNESLGERLDNFDLSINNVNEKVDLLEPRINSVEEEISYNKNLINDYYTTPMKLNDDNDYAELFRLDINALEDLGEGTILIGCKVQNANMDINADVIIKIILTREEISEEEMATYAFINIARVNKAYVNKNDIPYERYCYMETKNNRSLNLENVITAVMSEDMLIAYVKLSELNDFAVCKFDYLTLCNKNGVRTGDLSYFIRPSQDTLSFVRKNEDDIFITYLN